MSTRDVQGRTQEAGSCLQQQRIKISVPGNIDPAGSECTWPARSTASAAETRCRDDRLLVEEEEEEACMRVILQQQSVKAGCELIMPLMTGLLKTAAQGGKGQGQMSQEPATLTAAPTSRCQAGSQLDGYRLADL